jgi:H+-translocating NAD(P) transhydrogenase subunit alpha
LYFSAKLLPHFIFELMIIGILKEPAFERRVVLMPELVGEYTKKGIEILIEKNAGQGAFRADKDYENAGATLTDRKSVFHKAQIIIGIHPPDASEWDDIPKDTVAVFVFNPLQFLERVKALVHKNITAFSLDMLPRTTRAQSMDILSSMATVAGYKAVLVAANHLPQFFPMFMTAAGTISPAKVLILGAGVAGLQAIATARKLGAVVHVFDVRNAVKEEVMSLGGKFVEVEGAVDVKGAGGYAVEQGEDFLERQRKAIHDIAIKCNVVICTAQIPGKKAPILLFEDTMKEMLPGSVVVDLAAASGGNCALTQNDSIIQAHNITIVGDSNLPASLPVDSSRMFGKNLLQFIQLIIKDGQVNINLEDDIVESTCISHHGQIPSPRLQGLINL